MEIHQLSTETRGQVQIRLDLNKSERGGALLELCNARIAQRDSVAPVSLNDHTR